MITTLDGKEEEIGDELQSAAALKGLCRWITARALMEQFDGVITTRTVQSKRSRRRLLLFGKPFQVSLFSTAAGYLHGAP
jgi:hypothetical protein